MESNAGNSNNGNLVHPNPPSHIPVGSIGTTADQVSQILLGDARSAKIREKVRVSPGLSPTSFLKSFGIHDASRFTGMNTLDLGGGFGGLAKIIAETGAHVVVADPIFFEPNIQSMYLKDLTLANNRLENLQHKLKQTQDEILIPIIKRNLEKSKDVLDSMRFWEGYSIDTHPNIIRLAAYAEHLVGIDDHSMDAVFMANVATKTTLDPAGLVRELQRVTRPGGRVYIANNAGPDELPLIESLMIRLSHDWAIEQYRITKGFCNLLVRKV